MCNIVKRGTLLNAANAGMSKILGCLWQQTCAYILHLQSSTSTLDYHRTLNFWRFLDARLFSAPSGHSHCCCPGSGLLRDGQVQLFDLVMMSEPWTELKLKFNTREMTLQQKGTLEACPMLSRTLRNTPLDHSEWHSYVGMCAVQSHRLMTPTTLWHVDLA